MKQPPQDLIKTTEARLLLGIGQHKMKDLLASGELTVYTNKLDKRVKLVSRAEVERLKASSVRAAA